MAEGTSGSKDESQETRRTSSRSRSMDPDEARNKAAQIGRIFATVVAIILALGAILVAFQNNVNNANGLVRFILDVAGIFDGPLSRTNGLFVFRGDNAVVKSALVNWGLAAVVWLLIGRVWDRIVRVGS